MKILIVESDPATRRLLVDALRKGAATSRIEECATSLEAITRLESFEPDLLICEVEAPGVNGFTLLETLPPARRPAVIFVSKVDHFAARAFEVSAVDYLIKPIREERLFQAIQRAKNKIMPARSISSFRKLAIRSGRSVIFVNCKEIDWAEAEGKHVRLHMGKESLLLKMSISALEKELDPSAFARIHRSTIINLDRIRQIQPWTHHRTYQVILEDGTRLVLSRKISIPAQPHKVVNSTVW